MNCPSDEKLTQFAYQELGADDEQEIRRHLTECAHCREYLRDLTIIDGALAAFMQQQEYIEPAESNCPDAMGLAQYLNGSLTPNERECMESHLSNCQACVDELVAADEMQTKSRKTTPAHLLAQASQMGAPAPVAAKTTPSLLTQPRNWLETLTAAPRWVLVGAGACAVAVLGLYISQQIYRGIKPPETALNEIANHDKETAHSPADLIRESKIKLTPELKQALFDYNPKDNPNAEQQLLSLIQKQGADFSSAKIKNIEIRGDLLIAIRLTDLAGMIRLRQYKDGILVISADGN